MDKHGHNIGPWQRGDGAARAVKPEIVRTGREIAPVSMPVRVNVPVSAPAHVSDGGDDVKRKARREPAHQQRSTSCEQQWHSVVMRSTHSTSCEQHAPAAADGTSPTPRQRENERDSEGENAPAAGGQMGQEHKLDKQQARHLHRQDTSLLKAVGAAFSASAAVLLYWLVTQND